MVLAVLKMSGDRIPFRWGNLWRIFWASLGELSFEEMFVREFIMLFSSFASCRGIGHHAPMEPYARMGIVFYSVSWILFTFIRYYFLPSHWPLWLKFVLVTLYGIFWGVLILFFYHISTEQLIWAMFWCMCSVSILIINFE